MKNGKRRNLLALSGQVGAVVVAYDAGVGALFAGGVGPLCGCCVADAEAGDGALGVGWGGGSEGEGEGEDGEDCWEEHFGFSVLMSECSLVSIYVGVGG